MTDSTSAPFTSVTMQLAFLPSTTTLSKSALVSKQPLSRTTTSPRRPRFLMAAGKDDPDPAAHDRGESSQNGTPNEVPHAEVYRNGKERKWAGDDMPFDVRVISPPPRHLGRFRLHPRTGRGDIIEMGDTSYVVKRVRSHFVWSAGGGSGQAGPKLTRKTVETVSVARKSIEISLERTLRDS